MNIGTNKMQKKTKKRVLALVIFLLLALVLLPVLGNLFSSSKVSADMTQDEIEQEIKDNIGEQLGNLDFGALDRFVDGFVNGQKSIFGASSFGARLNALLNGDFGEQYGSVFEAILGLLFGEVFAFVPFVAMILAIVVIASIINSLKNERNKNLIDLIHFVCYGIVVVMVVRIAGDFILSTSSILNTLRVQMDIILPVLLTFMVAMGGVMSAGIYQPVVAILSGSIINLFSLVLMPILICAFVFAILGNLTTTVKFDKFRDFFVSLFKWIIGTVFTVFMAFLTLQGIIAGVHDGMAIKTLRYSISGSVPIIGGAISDGMGLVLMGTNLIKNAVGVAGITLIIATIIVPVVKIVVFGLMLKLTAAISEPISDSRLPEFLTSVSKLLPLLIVVILGTAFMFIITLLLIMFTANGFV